MINGAVLVKTLPSHSIILHWGNLAKLQVVSCNGLTPHPVGKGGGVSIPWICRFFLQIADLNAGTV